MMIEISIIFCEMCNQILHTSNIHVDCETILTAGGCIKYDITFLKSFFCFPLTCGVVNNYSLNPFGSNFDISRKLTSKLHHSSWYRNNTCVKLSDWRAIQTDSIWWSMSHRVLICAFAIRSDFNESTTWKPTNSQVHDEKSSSKSRTEKIAFLWKHVRDHRTKSNDIKSWIFEHFSN